jgi:hypothetical protein
MRRLRAAGMMLIIGSTTWTVTATAFDHTPASGSLARSHRAAPNVPPLDELVILDPRVDREGKPHPLVLPGTNGVPQVETPQTVIVHRYYYTGDRDFQGPMLQGGPVLLTVNDPATGDQIYVEAMLPPGAPRIAYRRDRIVYDYRNCAVTVSFGHPGPLGQIGKPSVAICHHAPGKKAAADHHERKQREINELWTRTGISDATHSCVQSVKQATNNAAGAVQTVGSQAIAPVKAVWNATPLSALTSSQVKQPAFSPTSNP